MLFLAVFGGGFIIGRIYEKKSILGEPNVKATFVCSGGEKIMAEFYDRLVRIELSRERLYLLPQTISGSGARYANKDESLVFWNKGDSAFIEEMGTTTLSGCVVQE
jgi:membrane-bound inhibitor of C-type lysozyme